MIPTIPKILRRFVPVFAAGLCVLGTGKLTAQTKGGGSSLKAPKINDGFIINAPSGYGSRKAPKVFTVEFPRDRIEKTQARVMQGEALITNSPLHEGTVVRNAATGPLELSLNAADKRNVAIVLPEEFQTSVLVVDLGSGVQQILPLGSPRVLLDAAKLLGAANLLPPKLKLTFVSPVSLKQLSCELIFDGGGNLLLRF